MPEKTDKNSYNKWKVKAVEKNKIIREQKKHISELRASRAKWKSKYIELKSKRVNCSDFSENSQTAKSHSYSLSLVLFCVQFLSYGKQSFRGCVHTLTCLSLCFRLNFKRLPCATTIRNWSCKMGYYRVHYPKILDPESDERWLVLIDESISIGCEKILLVLGAPLSHLRFNKALDLSQLQVLVMEISKSWKAEDIHLVLEQVKKNYPIGYIISDNGNNLKKSYLLGNYLHIPDITHSMSNILAHLYEKEDVFISFCESCSHLRKRWSLSKYSKFMPPTQRNKVRFANLFSLITWAKKCLDTWETLPLDVRNSLDFLMAHKSFLLEFYVIQCQNLALQKLLKKEGYSETTHEKAIVILNEYNTVFGTKQDLFKEKTLAYLALLSERKPKKMMAIHCSSDSIESAFGKLKQKIDPTSSREMTVFILTLASIGSAYSVEELKKRS